MKVISAIATRLNGIRTIRMIAVDKSGCRYAITINSKTYRRRRISNV